MRKWVALALLWGITGPAMADKAMSIEQMEQLLIRLHGKPDGKVAGELEDAQLTERVSPARLARWEADFPGKRSREELMKLADLTAFLNPPASDVLRDPPPDLETEERMLALAVDYVRLTTVRLPDFYATRETTHFEDSPTHRTDYAYSGSTSMDTHGRGLPSPTPAGGSTTEYRGLHTTGEFSVTVTYRDGHEVVDEDTGRRKQEEEAALGLTSSDEFGPILGALTNDVVHTGVSWLRWEQGNGEPAAVFHYAVPANLSHFRVGITVNGRRQTLFPAYHGEIEIDPATGEILRLSEVADPAPPNAGMRAAIVVDYAPVKIGDQSYICPVRGVAFSMIPVPAASSADELSTPVQINLNDVAFTHYHEFGSEARIVANAGPGSENGPAAADGNAPSVGSSAGPATAGVPAGTATPPGAGAAPEAASGAAPPAAENAPAQPSTSSVPTPSEGAPKPAEPPPAAESAKTIPAAGSNPAAAAPAGPSASDSAPVGATTEAPAMGTVLHQTQPRVEPTLKVTSRLVVVDVVVRKGDHPVSGLTQSDFALYEDGVPQTIHDFTPHFADKAAAPADSAAGPPPSLPPDTVTNLPVVNETDSITVMLLDGLNTAPSDVAYVRRAMIRFLKTQPPGRRMAVFALGQSLRMLQGFTTDSNQLTAALEKANASSPASLLPPEDQTFQERQQLADEAVAGVSGQDIANTRNFMSNADAGQTAMRTSLTLEAVQQLSRYLAGIEGRKNLIWFSGSFPLKFFAVVDNVFNGGSNSQVNPVIQSEGSFDDDLKETADMLVQARVAVYPVDARGGLTEPMVTATQQTDYANQVSGPPMSPAGTGQAEVFAAGQGGAYGTDRQLSEQQIASQHATMDILARQTGGRAVYESNGLQQAMADALSDGSNYYTLAYVPTNTNYNGAQRNIEVRLTQGKAELSYRRSYYADAEGNSPNIAGGAKSLISAAAVLGAPPSTQILFQARALPEGDPAITGPLPEKELRNYPTRDFKGAAHPYVVDLGVQLGDLTFAVGAGGAESTRLEIALVAYNSEGKPVNSLGTEFAVTLQAAQFQQLAEAGKMIPVRLTLDLPAGANVVRAVVYDPATAKTGSLEIPLQVSGAASVAGANASSK